MPQNFISRMFGPLKRFSFQALTKIATKQLCAHQTNVRCTFNLGIIGLGVRLICEQEQGTLSTAHDHRDQFSILLIPGITLLKLNCLSVGTKKCGLYKREIYFYNYTQGSNQHSESKHMVYIETHGIYTYSLLSRVAQMRPKISAKVQQSGHT